MTTHAVSVPMDVIFLGWGRGGLDDGFDYRGIVDTFGAERQLLIDQDIPFKDEFDRPIIRLGMSVCLPFTIHCFGHHMTFTCIGEQQDDMFELRQHPSGRFLLYRIDKPH